MSQKHQINPKIYASLTELKIVPARDPKQTRESRARFLRDLENVAGMGTVKRNPILLTFKTAIALALIGIILFSGIVTVAAQNSLPDASLYPLKLWTENVQLSLTASPQAKAAFLLELSEKRMDEIVTLSDQGNPPPEQVFNLLEQHIQQILTLASDMDDDTLSRTLLRLREFLQTQQNRIAQHQMYTNRETERLITQTRQRLQSYLDTVDSGLSDPQGFRNRENQSTEQQPTIEGTATAEPKQNQNNQIYQTPGNPESGTPSSQPTSDPKNGVGPGSGNDGDGSKNKDGSGNDGSGNGTGKGK